jgi:hypothetical protein
MAKQTTKPSDRGLDNPEPGPTPGTRAEQRGTAGQMDEGVVSNDPALAFEREQQEHLPPRGEGSQHNQGAEHGVTVRAKPEEPRERPRNDAGLQSGGDRGPSNQANTGQGTHSGRG